MKELIFNLQDQFQNYLLNNNDLLAEQVLSTDNVSTETRLNIYKEAYFARLLEALESTYPILKKYVGEEIFQKYGLAYIQQYPSHFRSIRWFGDKLNIFLKKRSPNTPYSELAQFEWIMSLVFDAADAKSIALQHIENISPERWENMCFKVHPSTHLVKFRWNVLGIWQSLSDEKPPPLPTKSNFAIPVITWRSDLICHFCTLPEAESWAIQAMMKGQTFVEICEGLCDWYPVEESPMQAASLLKGWITSGLISEIYFS